MTTYIELWNLKRQTNILFIIGDMNTNFEKLKMHFFDFILLYLEFRFMVYLFYTSYFNVFILKYYSCINYEGSNMNFSTKLELNFPTIFSFSPIPTFNFIFKNKFFFC